MLADKSITYSKHKNIYQTKYSILRVETFFIVLKTIKMYVCPVNTCILLILSSQNQFFCFKIAPKPLYFNGAAFEKIIFFLYLHCIVLKIFS